MALVIPTQIHSAIRRHLEGTFPGEGGGFMIGTQDGQNRSVSEVRFVENIFESEEQYHRYLMEAGAFQEAEDYAEENGLMLVGYFHSHPDHPAIPSEFDRANAMPNFMYLIVSVREGQAAESHAWELAESYERFNPVLLEEA
ncbi:MAG TPA: M67 family metallopeptidase [Aggregatilineales bacterium]|nr:M67 family metallopeptidase [Aggregatilineales bacterium]